MGNPFDLCTYTLNVQGPTYSASPALWSERSVQTDWSIDKPMSEERIDPYTPGAYAYISSTTDEMQGPWNETDISPGGSGDGCYIEECQAESCFFGCKGHHWNSQAGVISAIRSTKSPGLESEDSCASDGFSRVCFKPALQSSIREGNSPSWSENDAGNEYFSHAHPSSLSHGLAYHSRHASVPSSPTQPATQRQRRMSEPFNSIIRRHVGTGCSIGSSRSTSPAFPFKATIKARDPKPILFKTELCRSWEEKGSCRYGYVHCHALN
jgi:hypothetical protein